MNAAIDPTFEMYIVAFFKEQAKRKFFGDVTFKLQDGEIKHVLVNQSLDQTGFMRRATDNI